MEKLKQVRRIPFYAVCLLAAALLAVFSVRFTVPANAASPAGGTCGGNVRWTLDADGTLTVSGTGAMDDYSGYGRSPFSDWCVNGTVRRITVSPGVTRIGDYAFSGSASLASVDLPEGLTSLGREAFWGCTGLTSVSLPEGLTSIGMGAFGGCTGLTSVSLPDGLAAVGNSAFTGCASLRSISFPDGLRTIEAGAFTDCAGLTAVSLPEGLRSVGFGAFERCAGLQSLTLPEGVLSVDSNAFRDCTGLASVSLPDSLQTLGVRAFRDCTSLKELRLCGETVCEGSAYSYSYTESAFFNCPVERLTLTKKAELNGPCRNLRASVRILTLTEGIKTVEPGAFNVSEMLTEVRFPDTLETIGDSAFLECGNLRSVRLPDSLRTVGRDAFRKSGLTELRLPEGVRTLETGAFEECGDLRAVVLPSTLTEVGDGAFRDCAALSSLSVPKGVRSIGVGAFADCPALPIVALPDSVTQIGDSAFEGCAGLRSLTLPDGLRTIGGSAFSGCAGLTGLTLPDSVTQIGDSAFEGCAGLRSLTLPDGLRTIGGSAFSGCAGLTGLTLPDGLESIGAAAFQDCAGLKSLTVNGAATAEYSTFSGTGIASLTLTGERIDGSFPGVLNKKLLKKIEIRDGARYLADRLFTGCDNVPSVAVPASVTRLGWQPDGPKLIYARPAAARPTVLGNAVSSAFKTGIAVGNGDSGNSYFHLVTAHDPVTLTDADGNLWALSGLYTDTVTLIPRSGGRSVTFTCKGFRCGAGTVGPDNSLYLLWAHDTESAVLNRAPDTANVQVVRYTLSGKQTGVCPFSVKETQSRRPFDFGNAALVCSGEQLLVLWNTLWFNGHQGLERAVIDTRRMIVKALGTNTGSHSFGVAAIPTPRGFAYVQLYDGSNRGVNLTEIEPVTLKGDTTVFFGSMKAFSSPGQYGTNEHKLDGNKVYIHYPALAQSNTTFAVCCVGTDVYTTEIFQDSALQKRAVRDLYVRIVDRTLGQRNAEDCAGGVRKNEATGEVADRNLVRLTDLKNDALIRNVKAVVLPGGAYCVLWNQYDLDTVLEKTVMWKSERDRIVGFDPGVNGNFRIYDAYGHAQYSASSPVFVPGELHYAILDERGNILKPDTAVRGSLAPDYNTPPAVTGNTLAWAVNEEGKLTWVSLDLKLKDGSGSGGSEGALRRGDPDGDGMITASDARLALRASVGLEPAIAPGSAKYAACEVDGDGTVTALDARSILRVSVGLERASDWK